MNITPVCTAATEAIPADHASWFSTRAQIAWAACACGAASAFVFAVDPNRHAVYPQCMLYNMTGIYCAGCGATRAVYALLHGRVLEALHDNALFVAALPLLLYVLGSYALNAWRANAWPAVKVDGRRLVMRGIAIFVVMIAFMVLRNLPGEAFVCLRPLVTGG
jgi:hypothetical protein